MPHRRILVIDDNPAIHEDYRKVLAARARDEELNAQERQLFGTEASPQAHVTFEVDSALQGQEGLKLVQQALAEGRPYATAFVDIRMPPGWDGIETVARLWEVCPELQIVICSAHSDYSWEEMVARLGHSDRLVILKKPFDNIEVLQLACALTEKWRLLQEVNARLEGLETEVRRRTAELEREIGERKSAEEQLRGNAERYLRQHSALSMLARREWFHTDDLTAVLRCIAETDAQASRVSRIGIWRFNAERTKLLCVELYEAEAHRHSAGMALEVASYPAYFHALATSEVLAADDARLDPRTRAFTEPYLEPLGITSMLDAPIYIDGVLEGVVCHEHVGALRRWTPDECTFAVAIANCVSLVMEQWKRRQTEQALANSRTERSQLEEQLRQSQKMESIGRLAGGVAHDFNNILTVIEGHAELMRGNNGLDPAQSESIHEISLATERAAGLTRQLLTFSRKQVCHPSDLDLNDVVLNMSKMLERILGEDISLSVECVASAAFIRADRGMMEQVLLNLAVNARDAMPQGGRLAVRTAVRAVNETQASLNTEARPGRFVCLTVSDTGCGIAPENMSRIFEPFFTTKDVGKGTGLGLATVYGIVRQHQGWIQVDSQMGKGTTFTIMLPAVETTRLAARKTGDVALVAGGHETILVVEDEMTLRNLVAAVLKRQGYRVLLASTGREALEVWQREQRDIKLLLTDLIMPDGMNGWDLATALRARDPRLKVVVTSGYSPDMTAHQLEEMKQVPFLQKPYRPRTLVTLVRDCLDGRGGGASNG
ncbi:MAG: response regulator [Verrucomicrobiota bacterium]